MLKRLESKGLVTWRRRPTDERRVLVDLISEATAQRKKTEQMLGEFYCFLKHASAGAFDLKDRLRILWTPRAEGGGNPGKGSG